MDENNKKDIDLDDFSKKVVGSLFKDKEQNGRKAEDLERDPVKEYENRKFENKALNLEGPVEKFFERNSIDKQLEDFPKPKRRSDTSNIARPAPRPNTERISERDAYRPSRSRLNTSRIAAVFIVLTLGVSLFMVFQINSANSELAAANYALENAQLSTSGLLNQIAALEAENAGLELRIYELQAYMQLFVPYGYVELPYIPYVLYGGAYYYYDYDGEITLYVPVPLPYTSVDAQGNLIYIVQEGDSLWSIATNVLGNGSLYPSIMALNSITNPDEIQVGDSLIMPPQ